MIGSTPVPQELLVRNTVLLLLLSAAALPCCGDGSSSGQQHCTYESRHSPCGGSGFGAWTTECYAFNLDDYKEGWTADRVCQKFSGSDTECSSTCCIYVEYRNSTVGGGGCP
jgi:hypothetical protein